VKIYNTNSKLNVVLTFLLIVLTNVGLIGTSPTEGHVRIVAYVDATASFAAKKERQAARDLLISTVVACLEPVNRLEISASLLSFGRKDQVQEKLGVRRFDEPYMLGSALLAVQQEKVIDPTQRPKTYWLPLLENIQLQIDAANQADESLVVFIATDGEIHDLQDCIPAAQKIAAAKAVKAIIVGPIGSKPDGSQMLEGVTSLFGNSGKLTTIVGDETGYGQRIAEVVK
jgi:intracellular sulfur oxidation DsrE/DsrF family protein